MGLPIRFAGTAIDLTTRTFLADDVHLQLEDGSSVPVSDPATVRVRYNASVPQIEQSINGGPYTPLGGGILAEIPRPWGAGQPNELRVDPVTKCIYLWSATDSKWIAFGETTTNYSLFVDPVAGDDTAAGDAANPLKTVDEAMNRTPGIVNHFVQVQILPGTLPWIYVSNKRGNGLVAIMGSMRLAAGLVGPNSGTATGGTKISLTRLGAGWVVNELRGKKCSIIAGTHAGYDFRIISNTVDTMVLSGLQTAAFDNTDQFEIWESEVLVKEVTNVWSDVPLQIRETSAWIIVAWIDFENNDNVNQNYVCSVSQVDSAWVWDCSFKATHAAGAFGRYTVLVSNNPEIGFDTCAFISDDAISGSWSGFYFSGPNEKIEFYNCVENDFLECYYGCVQLNFYNCTRVFRPGTPQFDVYRSISGRLQMTDSYIDFALVRAGFRVDGPQSWDVRRCEIWRAAGDGWWSDGHFAEGTAIYLNNVKVSGCTSNGINLGMNSTLAIYNVTTDPAALNGRFGVRIRTGTCMSYTGVNTIAGTLGEVNLGDNVTAVPLGTPATDVTQLTRMAPFGA